MTVTSVDGDTRVTVRKGGETIAEDLPYEKLETLPAEVRDDVRELIGRHDIELIEPIDPGVRELEPRGRVKI